MRGGDETDNDVLSERTSERNLSNPRQDRSAGKGMPNGQMMSDWLIKAVKVLCHSRFVRAYYADLI
jgi:hypothetical protein